MNLRRTPRVLFDLDLRPTADHHKEALAETEIVLTSCRDLVRRLDLPADAVLAAASVYGHAIQAAMARSHREAEQRRYAKQDEIYKLRLEREKSKVAQRMHAQPAVGGWGIGINGPDCDDVCEMDDAQLDAELERLQQLPTLVP